MKDVMNGFDQLITIVAIACIIVLSAMIVDLFSGWIKATQRGEFHRSWVLKRSLTKFVLYEGGMLIAAGIDALIHLCKLLLLFRLDIIYGLPIATCLLGCFLLGVEWLSIREKADEKTQKRMCQVGEAAAMAVNKKMLVDAFTEAIGNTINKNKEKE